MFLRIEELAEKLLVGKSQEMSLSRDMTGELWKSFMPLLSKIENRSSDVLFSLQLYPQTFSYQDYTPEVHFTKWAAVAVKKESEIPASLSKLKIKKGTYAVFLHKGTAFDFRKTMDYIFQEWLPKSIFEVDDRPHFEILGKEYKNNDPASKEEVWIPVKEKAQ